MVLLISSIHLVKSSLEVFETGRPWIHYGSFSRGGEQVNTSYCYCFGGVCVRAVDLRLAVARYALRHFTEADCQRPNTTKLETGFSLQCCFNYFMKVIQH